MTKENLMQICNAPDKDMSFYKWAKDGYTVTKSNNRIQKGSVKQ